MLTAIREGISGWIVWVIVGLICITFALFGIQEYLDGLNRVVVAEVEGEEIEYEEYQNALQNRRQNLIRTFGGRVNSSLFSTDEFKTQTVEDLVAQRLLVSDVRKSGYQISDEQLSTLIQNVPNFQDADGKFNREQYDYVLRSQGLTAQRFEEMQRQQNAVEQIRNGFSSSAFVTEGELKRLVALSEETRDTAVALIPISRYTETVEATEEEIKAEYETNKENWRAPDRIKVAYVELSVDKLVAETSVSEDDLKAAYELQRAEYLDEERRKARHILIQLAEDADADTDKEAFEKAKAILEEAKAGDFEAIAKEKSEDTGSAASGGDLGLVGRGVMVKPFEDALFAMDVDSISAEPVRSRFGYHIIKLEEIQAERIKEFDEVKDDIETSEKRRLAEERFSALVENFRNVVFEESESLEPAAGEIDATVQVSDWIARDQGTGLFAPQNVRDAAFSTEVLEEGLNSSALDVDDNTVIALRKVEYEESKIRPLEDVRADVETAVKNRKATEAAKALGTEIIASLEKGDSWEEVLAEAELVPVEGPSKRRDQAATPANRALTEAVFSAPVPEADKPIYGGEFIMDSQYAVYRLSSVVPGDVEKIEDAAKTQLTERVRRRVGDEAFLNYQAGLRDRSDVKINASNIINPPDHYQRY